jgi:UDP-glucose 4-epimerase
LRSFSWSDSKILVTGGRGFFGAHLCRYLHAKGAEVHATSRFKRHSGRRGPVWWQADFSEIDSVRSVLGAINPDVIFHLSGTATAAPEPQLVAPTFESLVKSAVNILMVATGNGCRRIVLTGSSTEPACDNGEIVPNSPYAVAKLATAAYGHMFRAVFDAPVVVVRPFMTYGPGQDCGKLIPYVIRALLTRQVPKLSGGRLRADWIYIDDVIEGLVAAGEVSNLPSASTTIDLGSGRLVSVREIVEQLVLLTRSPIQPLFGAVPDRPLERQRIAHAENPLGWKAVTSLEDGLRKTIDWYKRRLPRPRVQAASATRLRTERETEASCRQPFHQTPCRATASASRRAVFGACRAVPVQQNQTRAQKFRQLDVNGDGSISRAEAHASPELAVIFTEIDASGDGGISENEFVAVPLVQPDGTLVT